MRTGHVEDLGLQPKDVDETRAEQEEAAGETVQLNVQMPYRGRVIEFTRSVQVQENADMNIQFVAREKDDADAGSIWWAFGLLVILSLCFWCCPRIYSAWGCVADRAAQKPAGEERDEEPMGDEAE